MQFVKKHEIFGLDLRGSGIELDSVRSENGQMFATVYVPPGKLRIFLKRLDAYANKPVSSGKKPKHAKLVESIAGIRLAVVRSFWTDDDNSYPADEEQTIWWEVWLRGGEKSPRSERLVAFRSKAQSTGIHLSDNEIRFPERTVLLARCSVMQWASSVRLLNDLAELRKAKEIPTDFLDLSGQDQGAFVRDAAGRITFPGPDAPAVCLLDTGVLRNHPLLEPAIAATDVLAADPTWAPVDEDRQRHGTCMAGIALFGDGLADLVAGTNSTQLRHRLESVKILPPPHLSNDPALYGHITQEAVARAETQNPTRARSVCMAISSDDERDHGRPSSWSAALDEHASGALDGKHRLYAVATGNRRDICTLGHQCPEANHESAGIEDPGQSWNALTVGGYTEKVTIRSNDFDGWQPLAQRGALSPTSRTSTPWADDSWPIKPDVVMEAGNYARDAAGNISNCTDMELLTTTVRDGRLFDTMRDTSAATAQVARMGAIIWSHYPELWPETVRGLILHSARWTDHMRREFPDTSKASLRKRLRCYGYGVPDIDRALWSLENQVTIVQEGELQPFRLDGTVKTNEYHRYPMPWPLEVLEDLAEADVTLRITLSYFVEPSPGGRGRSRKFSYQSCGLRFAVKGPTESSEVFGQRISKDARADDEEKAKTAEPQNWTIGTTLRRRGSVHSDSWTTSAAEVASAGEIAVFPVSGWWKTRKHLERYDQTVKYSLIVSIETSEVDVQLYSAIASILQIPISIAT